MASDHHPLRKRKLFSTANKYQREIVLLAFIPSGFIFLAFNLIVFLANPAFCKVVFHETYITAIKNTVNMLPEILVCCMILFFILSLIVAFNLSHNMVGAFDRIIREMDDIIAGKSQRTISSRPNDTLSKELLKRINVLIKGYVENKNASST